MDIASSLVVLIIALGVGILLTMPFLHPTKVHKSEIKRLKQDAQDKKFTGDELERIQSEDDFAGQKSVRKSRKKK